MRSVSLLLFGLIYVAGVHSYFKPCTRSCTREASAEVLAKINLILYNGETENDNVIIPIGETGRLLSLIDLNKPTVIYIPGDYNQGTPVQTSTEDIARAYIAVQTSNFIVLDWNIVSSGSSRYVLKNVEAVGSTLAEAIAKLVEGGLVSSTLTLVGRGMGAHVASYAGLYSPQKLTKIVGLDPTINAPERTLSTEDAEYVFVIHTAVGGLGSRHIGGVPLQIGTADFYVNRGRPLQPGCRYTMAGDFCSHFRAAYLYAESVRNPSAFAAVQCSDVESFQRGLCSGNNVEYLGAGTSNSASGRYYLTTGSTSPYTL